MGLVIGKPLRWLTTEFQGAQQLQRVLTAHKNCRYQSCEEAERKLLTWVEVGKE
jgi:hypothetical protein